MEHFDPYHGASLVPFRKTAKQRRTKEMLRDSTGDKPMEVIAK